MGINILFYSALLISFVILIIKAQKEFAKAKHTNSNTITQTGMETKNITQTDMKNINTVRLLKYSNCSFPIKRFLNDDDNDDFVALDVETMTKYNTSICAIGMVKVIDGQIANKYYALVNPIRDELTEKELNFNIHGISLTDCEKAMAFDEQFDSIKNFIGTLKIVAHNSAFDISCLNDTMEFYGLDGINTSNENVIDTYQETGLSLTNACERFNISLNKHHNALDDAEACAKIHLHIIGKDLITLNSGNYFKDTRKKISSEHRGFLESNNIINNNTIFNKKKITITGVFDTFPIRDQLAALFQKLGGRVMSGLCKSTNIVIIGNNPGPAKIQKIEEMINQGMDIKCFNERDLILYLNQENIQYKEIMKS